MKSSNFYTICLLGVFSFFFGTSVSWAIGLTVQSVTSDLSKAEIAEDLWKGAAEEVVSLMAQPMALPRPKTTETANLRVQAIHDGKWIAFRLKWADPERSEAGRLGEFSDAVALEFPVKDNNSPPPIFMGAKDNPVHVFHWRAQYQVDKERGMRSMQDLYPNMNADMYPMEFKDQGNLKGLTDEKREVFSPGIAVGNPQSYRKKGIDEIFAEGFSTSAVIENTESAAVGKWNRDGWTVVIARALKREKGSVLEVGKGSFLGFAVWQGGKDEVGARKSVTMSWLPFHINVPKETK